MPLIEIEKKDSVAYCYLNRPEKLNSFNAAMAAEFLAALERLSHDSTVRALVISGRGRGFCAGQDLADFLTGQDPASSSRPDLGEVVRRCYNPAIRLIREMPKPVVCAVQGVAAGAGANLALNCDFVVASSEASFVQSFSKVGLVPDSGGTFILPRLLGLARATALTMLATKLSAADALEMGLIYRVYPPDAFSAGVDALAAELAGLPTAGLALAKRALNQSFENNLEKQLELEAHLQTQAGFTHDFQEGVKAFLEKRPPAYTGQ